jgi:LPXTG-motif cell wall-anchored protein
VISGNKVTFPSLGNYTLGQDPIVLTINARIPTSSGAGVLRDTVNVTAALGNCRGGANGEDIVNGNAQLNGSAITGAVTLVAPNVSRGDLAATGGNSWPLVAGGGFLLAALGLVRLRRRVTDPTAPAES